LSIGFSANHPQTLSAYPRKNQGFETDTLLELLNTINKHARESAVRILQEYTYAIMRLKNKKSKTVVVISFLY